MTSKRALLLTRMDPPPSREAEWNKWYNTIYLPARLAIPGFLAVRRFELAEGLPERFVVPAPKYLTLAELADADVLKSKPYLELLDKERRSPSGSFEALFGQLPNLSGGVYQQIFPDDRDYRIPEAARYLLAVGHADLPPEREEEYNAWYNTEHVPSYLQIPGFLHARRFHVVKGTLSVMGAPVAPGPDYIAIYDLATDKAFETDDFKQRSATPWSARVRSWTWSRRKMTNLYRCTYTRIRGGSETRLGGVHPDQSG